MIGNLHRRRQERRGDRRLRRPVSESGGLRRRLALVRWSMLPVTAARGRLGPPARPRAQVREQHVADRRSPMDRGGTHDMAPRSSAVLEQTHDSMDAGPPRMQQCGEPGAARKERGRTEPAGGQAMNCGAGLGHTIRSHP